MVPTCQEAHCLVQLNKGPWKRRLIQWSEYKVDFIDSDFFSLECRIRPDSCLKVQKCEGFKIEIEACPKIDGNRTHTVFDILFDNIQCQESLIKFMIDNGFLPSTRKKILVLINPVSGKGKALKIWNNVHAMVGQAAEFEVIQTKKAGHAQELAHNLDINHYGGIVTVSGDGGLWEIVNGLYTRKDWNEVASKFPIGMVPGGSGHAMHCSLLYHQKESFDQEYIVSALNIGRGNSMVYDHIECTTEDKSYISLFGVAWGVIPEVDVGSEFMRFLGPNRGRLLGIWRWFIPRFHPGTVYYQTLEDQSEMPDINDPVPKTWKCVEGPFLNVYASKQPWLDYEMLFCPDAKAGDGILWLVVIKGTIDRWDSLYWLLNGQTSGHLQSKHTFMIPIKAFRFIPSDGKEAPMTIDAELLQGGKVQGKVKQNGVNIMVK